MKIFAMKVVFVLPFILRFSLAIKPNILFIVADDLGWNDVSWHNREMKTANLEKLARSGIILDQSYVQPVCSPSRAAFLTGYYPFRIGRQNDYIEILEPAGLQTHLKLLPEVLKDYNYSTHIVGKWHLGFCNWSYTPTVRGFDSFFGFYGGSEDHYSHMAKETIIIKNETYTVNGIDLRNNTNASTEHNGEYSTFLFQKAAIKIIEKHDISKPLFMYLPFQAVHAPLQVPKKYEDIYSHIKDSSRRTFSAMVTALDDAVGAVYGSLVKKGIMWNTVIIFTTDNGGQVLYGGNNWPLRGNKATLYEGGTRGVAFVHSPLLEKTNYISNKLIHAVDWYPTIIRLAGGTKNALNDGFNVWDMLNRDGPPVRNEFVYNIYDSETLNGALRYGEYKLIVGPGGDMNGWYPLANDSYHSKNEDFSDSTMKLYNLERDPLETNDLSKEQQDVTKKLKDILVKYSKKMIPAFSPPQDIRGNPTHWGGVFTPGWCKAKS